MKMDYRFDEANRERKEKKTKERILSQRFCVACGGLIQLKADNCIISSKNWTRYGMACDIGCVCA